MFSYLSTHVQAAGENIIEHFHLNPAHESPTIFVRTLAQLQNKDLWLLSMGGLGYSIIRLIEAYGLWYHRRWAKWIAVISSAVYLPFEVVALCHRFSWTVLGILSLNFVILLYLLRVLRKKLENRELT